MIELLSYQLKFFLVIFSTRCRKEKPVLWFDIYLCSGGVASVGHWRSHGSTAVHGSTGRGHGRSPSSDAGVHGWGVVAARAPSAHGRMGRLTPHGVVGWLTGHSPSLPTCLLGRGDGLLHLHLTGPAATGHHTRPARAHSGHTVPTHLEKKLEEEKLSICLCNGHNFRLKGLHLNLISITTAGRPTVNIECWRKWRRIKIL